MPDGPTTHPSAQELQAFGLGKLVDAEAESVASHLGECPACLRVVQRVDPDSFLGRVKRAKPPDSTSLPSRAAAPPADVPPDLANHSKFRVLRKLGQGGMGAVYLVEHRIMKQLRAIKVIDKALLERPGALERFHTEARAAARLAHHNIVQAYDAEQAGDLHMLVMEYVEGTSLAEVVAARGPLPVAEACNYAHQAALGLEHARDKGMVHRDVKPHNLMLTPEGRVKVLDFGLARVAGEGARGLTATGALMGTPDYIAPEQAWDARTADTRADVYSLGCTLYCLLAGRPPFRGATPMQVVLAHLEKEATPLHRLRRDVPPELSAVVARMMAKKPPDRYPTPLEAARALAPFVKKASGVQPPAAPAAPARDSAGTGTVAPVDTPSTSPVQRKPAPGRLRPAAEPQPSPFEGLGEVPAPARATPRVADVSGRARLRQGLIAGAAVLTIVLLAVGIGWYSQRDRWGVDRHPNPSIGNVQQGAGGGEHVPAIPGKPTGGGPEPGGGPNGKEEVENTAPKPRIRPVVPEDPKGRKGQVILQGLLHDDNVFVDDKPQDHEVKDGEVRLDVEAGPRRLKVTRKRYRPWEKEVVVTAGESATRTVNPKRLQGKLVLEKLPPGARVQVDGEEVPRVEAGRGPTEPLSLNVDAGSHELRITADGFEPYSEQVTIDPDTPSHPRVTLRAKEPGPKGVTSAAVGRGVDKAVIDAMVARAASYLKSIRGADGTWPNKYTTKVGGQWKADFTYMGATALCGLALLEAGEEAGIKRDDPAIARAAKAVREASPTLTDTYSLSLGIMFLDRLGDPADVELIDSMAVRLLAGQDSATGGWSYECPPLSADEQARMRKLAGGRTALVAQEPPAGKKPPKDFKELPPEMQKQVRQAEAGWNVGGGDNSNTQFAILALWIARRQGIPVEAALRRIGSRFRTTQNQDGGWGYEVATRPGGGPGSSPAMTCTGLLGLAFVHGSDREATAKANPPGGKPVRKPAHDFGRDPAIQTGLKALGGFVTLPLDRLYPQEPQASPRDACYFLFSLERVAVVYGLDRVGGIDWYDKGREFLLRTQGANGSWVEKNAPGGADTCFAILFLRRTNLVKDLSQLLRTLKTADVGAEGGKNARSAVPAPAPPPAAASPPPTDAAAARLSAGLVNAPADRQEKVLDKLRDSKGTEYTDALAAAIHKLDGPVKARARDALADRLSRFSSKTLTDKLQDDDFEVRRAVALAVAMNNDRDNVPRVIGLLEDREDTVVQAARAALKFISKEDFGPKPDAGPGEVARAIVEWKEWWKKSGGK